MRSTNLISRGKTPLKSLNLIFEQKATFMNDKVGYHILRNSLVLKNFMDNFVCLTKT